MTVQLAVNNTAPGNYSYTAQQQTINGTSMWVVQATSTGFAGESQAGNATLYVLTNGTIVEAVINGQTMSGFEAFAGLAYIIPFFLVSSYDTAFASIYTSQYVSVVNMTTIPLGGGIQVTNYAPKSLPFTYTDCGQSYTLNQFDIQIGMIHGYTLLTYFLYSGTSNGTPNTVSFKITSLTVG